MYQLLTTLEDVEKSEVVHNSTGKTRGTGEERCRITKLRTVRTVDSRPLFVGSTNNIVSKRSMWTPYMGDRGVIAVAGTTCCTVYVSNGKVYNVGAQICQREKKRGSALVILRWSAKWKGNMAWR